MVFSGHASSFSIYATAVSLAITSCIAVVVRLGARVAIVGQLCWSDVLIVGAWMCNIVMGVSMGQIAKHGSGQRSIDLTPSDLEVTLHWFWAFLWVYYTSLCFTKLSVLMQYLRVFQIRSCIRCCRVLIAIVVAWGSWSIFSAVFTCWPISQYWTHSGWAAPECLSRKSLWYINAAINIITDVSASLLPLPIISTLDISRRQKCILKAVFASGLVTCIFSSIRLAYMYPLAVFSDFAWQSPLAIIWTFVEANSAVICACAPSFRGLVQRSVATDLASAQTSQLWPNLDLSVPLRSSALVQNVQRTASPETTDVITRERNESTICQPFAVMDGSCVYQCRTAKIEPFFERQTLDYMRSSAQSLPSSTPKVDDITALPQIQPPAAAAKTQSSRGLGLV